MLFRSGVDLSPGEQGLADGAGAVTKREVDVNDYVAWQKGQFVFRHRTLEEVIRVVCRWYNVEAVFESEGAKGITSRGTCVVTVISNRWCVCWS